MLNVAVRKKLLPPGGSPIPGSGAWPAVNQSGRVRPPHQL